MKPTPPPWRWLTSNTLIADYGRRNVVLIASKKMPCGTPQLQACNEEGRLVPFDMMSPDGRKIAAAGQMALELNQIAGKLEEWAARVQSQNAIVGREISRAAHDLRAYLSGIEP